MINKYTKAEKSMTIKKTSAMAYAVAATIVLINFTSYASPPDTSYKAFSTKLIFTETPDIGPKWRGGIRMTDVLAWDFYFNVAGWFNIDFFAAGFPTITGGDSTKISDNFTLFSIKSLPLRIPIGNNMYKLAGGIKYHAAEFKITGKDGASFSENSYWTVPFLAQGFLLGNRNHFNLFSSAALENRNLGTGRQLFASYCFVPGYRFFISSKWSLGLEYAVFNARKLPLNLLWYLFDADGVAFDNPNADWYSLMFWGASFTGRHFRADFNIACHYTFQGPIVPMFGIGWNF
jgi:hypothetical protein